MIVGQNPGRQREGQQNCQVFHGNRTGDLVEEAIEGLTNIILTNACNYQLPHEQGMDYEGWAELRYLIQKHEPRKVICLGEVAYNVVLRQRIKGLKIVKMVHPSWVNRFNHGDRKPFIKQLRRECHD